MNSSELAMLLRAVLLFFPWLSPATLVKILLICSGLHVGTRDYEVCVQCCMVLAENSFTGCTLMLSPR